MSDRYHDDRRGEDDRTRRDGAEEGREGDRDRPDRGNDVDAPRGYSPTLFAWTEPGPFTGRGPRGYHRSDDRIREDVCDRLTRHGRLDATDITVTVRHGAVTLEGMVDNRDAKRMAQEVTASVDGVQEVNNHLETWRGSGEGGGRTSAEETTFSNVSGPANVTESDRGKDR